MPVSFQLQHPVIVHFFILSEGLVVGTGNFPQEVLLVSGFGLEIAKTLLFALLD